MNYLGHVIGGGQVRPDPLKLDAVKAYLTPKDKKEVRAFLGLAGYRHSFVPHFSTILLSHLLNSQREKIQTK